MAGKRAKHHHPNYGFDTFHISLHVAQFIKTEQKLIITCSLTLSNSNTQIYAAFPRRGLQAVPYLWSGLGLPFFLMLLAVVSLKCNRPTVTFVTCSEGKLTLKKGKYMSTWETLVIQMGQPRCIKIRGLSASCTHGMGLEPAFKQRDLMQRAPSLMISLALKNTADYWESHQAQRDTTAMFHAFSFMCNPFCIQLAVQDCLMQRKSWCKDVEQVACNTLSSRHKAPVEVPIGFSWTCRRYCTQGSFTCDFNGLFLLYTKNWKKLWKYALD